MSWYRRTKLLLASSRRNIKNPPMISPESPSSNAFSKIHRNGSSNLSPKFSGFSISSRILGLRLCNTLGNMNINVCNRFLSIPRKFDCVDRHQVHPFNPPEPRRWFQNPAAVLAAVLVGSGVLVTGYWNQEPVPYTKRRQFVLWPTKSIVRWVDKYSFEPYGRRILPADHPESIRVNSIVKDIIEGSQRSLSLESVRNASMDGTPTENDGAAKDTAKGLNENCGKGTTSGMKGKEEGSQPSISHFEGSNWEVLVVKGPDRRAFCSSAGKIVVYTGLLEYLETDAEIATVIGPEISSVIARNSEQELSYWICWWICLLVCLYTYKPLVQMIPFFLVSLLSFLKDLDAKEADRIGMILVAAAGYDPRVASEVYLKLGMRERAWRFAVSKIMEEALVVYHKQAESGFGEGRDAKGKNHLHL
ncbi:PREDICTED: uncharacterized protein LOC104825080 isoform X2 [Tarenaya hassleriana]|nr:PREDICTED: uncharacterized protein LOC104825080 isoform X2 [Tarenaya hassleriana]